MLKDQPFLQIWQSGHSQYHILSEQKSAKQNDTVEADVQQAKQGLSAAEDTGMKGTTGSSGGSWISSALLATLSRT